MKNFYISLLAASFALFTCQQSQAQDEPSIPPASSSQTLIQSLGLGKITITYSRPNVKGRKVFGGLEPYGKVWRTGANTATLIKFSEDMMVEGHLIPAGDYGLFTIPKEDSWTIIFSKNPKQWGAYSYKEAEDFLRVDVKPMKMEEAIETFTMQFANVKGKTAELHIMWDHTAVPVKFSVNDYAKVSANIEQMMKTAKKPYFDAITYYYENNLELNKALGWAEEAQKTNPKGPYYILWKARILLKLGRKQEALAAAEEGVRLARESKDDEYVRLNQAVADQAKS
jgi:tetratricopeptide (TPR) repeat protein